MYLLEKYSMEFEKEYCSLDCFVIYLAISIKIGTEVPIAIFGNKV